MITSTSNAKVKRLVNLKKKKKLRDEEGVFLVEGIRMFREVPKDRLVEVYASEEFWNRERKAVEQVLAGTKVQPEILADFVFEYVSDTKTPQGILCLVRQKQYSITEIVKEKDGELPLLLVLDQIQDPGNLGTIVRTAEGAGVTGIVMSQDCVDMYNPKVVRSTMGAAYRVPFCYVDDLAEEVKQMKEAGICTYAAHLEGKNSYDEEDYRKASAFLIGNEANGLTKASSEGNGLRDEVAEQAQVYIRIPMKGQVESLNAAVATAILTFEAARQRR